MFAVLYAGHVLELIASILTLYKSSSHVGIPLLARGVFETTVRIACLANNPRKAEMEFELEDLLDRRKFHNEILTVPQNSQVMNEEEVRKLTLKIETLQSNGVKVQNMQQRLKDLGATVNYSSFRFLSSFAHGQLIALGSQSVLASSDVNKVELFRPLDEEFARSLFRSLSLMTRKANEYAGRVLAA